MLLQVKIALFRKWAGSSLAYKNARHTRNVVWREVLQDISKANLEILKDLEDLNKFLMICTSFIASKCPFSEPLRTNELINYAQLNIMLRNLSFEN